MRTYAITATTATGTLVLKVRATTHQTAEEKAHAWAGRTGRTLSIETVIPLGK